MELAWAGHETYDNLIMWFACRCVFLLWASRVKGPGWIRSVKWKVCIIHFWSVLASTNLRIRAANYLISRLAGYVLAPHYVIIFLTRWKSLSFANWICHNLLHSLKPAEPASQRSKPTVQSHKELTKNIESLLSACNWQFTVYLGKMHILANIYSHHIIHTYNIIGTLFVLNWTNCECFLPAIFAEEKLMLIQ